MNRIEFEKCILESRGKVLTREWSVLVLAIFSFLNNLCLGLDGDNNVVMKETDDGDNSQFWTWNDDNDSLRNRDGMALDICGGDDDAGAEQLISF